MKTAEMKDLRKEIKTYIDEADDRMVKIIYAMLEADKTEDWWNDVSDEEKSSIDRGLSQLKDGKGIPHDEVVKQHAKWFRK